MHQLSIKDQLAFLLKSGGTFGRISNTKKTVIVFFGGDFENALNNVYDGATYREWLPDSSTTSDYHIDLTMCTDLNLHLT